MEDQEKEYQQDEWKDTLRSELIKVLTGDSKEREQVYEEIGYYYQCCAPASLYKYYPDDQLHLKSVTNNQIWYSAPCNFNDVFDCDITIDDQKVFNKALKLFPDNRAVRPGSKNMERISGDNETAASAVEN